MTGGRQDGLLLDQPFHFHFLTMTSLQRAAGFTPGSSGGFSATSGGETSTNSGQAQAGVRRPRPQGSNPNASSSNSNPKRGGIFEASFGGLDLSEFGAGASSSADGSMSVGQSPPVSAAAALLREKTLEVERTQREAEEEAMIQANAVALAQEQTKRLAAMKEKHDVEGRDNGRSNHLLSGGSGSARPADGMEFIGQGMFATLVHMHGNDDHGAKREGNGNTSSKSTAAVRTKTSKLAGIVASKRAGSSSSSNNSAKRISRLAKVSSKKSPNKGGIIAKKTQRSKGAIKKGKRSKF